MPKWVVSTVAGAFALIASAAIAWAVNIDGTQRMLLQDVSGLKESRERMIEQLGRIEDKVDRLLENWRGR